MKKSTKRLIVFGSVVGAVMISAFVCYGISKSTKSSYNKVNQDLLKAQNGIITQQDKIAEEQEKEEPNQAVIDAANAKIAEYTAAIPGYESKLKTINATYEPLAVASYGLTIGALASFGICLYISDKIKEKEEKEAGKN